MHRSRKDGTHDARARDFAVIGCTVLDMHAIGIAGVPDFVVGCLGVDHLVECKDSETAYGRAGLSESQSAFARGWNGGPVAIVRSTDDVIALVEQWRKRKA